MREDPENRSTADPGAARGVLDAQAAQVRDELARLSATLVTVRDALEEDRATLLLAANAQLVQAALLADSIAEKALLSLAHPAGVQPEDASTGAAAASPRVELLETAIAMARRRQTHLAVVVLGFDDPSDPDGRAGRGAGEAAMQAAASRLESVLRKADTVSLEPGQPVLTVTAEVAQAADTVFVVSKLATVLAAPVQIDGLPVRLAARFGVAVYPFDGAHAAVLLGLAEQAMRRATRGGTGVVQYASALGEFRGTSATATATATATAAGPSPPSQNMRDVNERLVIAAVNAQTDLANAQDKSRELQVRFLAMVAHELRNPLMPIRTAAELLMRARDDEAMLLRLQDVIKRQVAQMSRLVDDLLDTARITSGRFRLVRERADLTASLRVARDACQPVIESRLQQLVWQVPTDPIPIEADPTRLAQVFSNLLDNASKYTPRGGRLAVVLARDDGGVAVTVSDNGRGISATTMPHIFDLFEQDARTIAFGGGGLGIGLAVVRELVEAHGGSIVARSAGVDQGSDFIVKFPLA